MNGNSAVLDSNIIIDASKGIVYPYTKLKSPLDIEGVDTNITKDEIINIIREFREREY